MAFAVSTICALPRRLFRFFRRDDPPGLFDGESWFKGVIVVLSSSSLRFSGVSGIGAVDTVFALSCEHAGISASTAGVPGSTALGVWCRDWGGREIE